MSDLERRLERLENVVSSGEKGFRVAVIEMPLMEDPAGRQAEINRRADEYFRQNPDPDADPNAGTIVVIDRFLRER